jgi:hypothetical protein
MSLFATIAPRVRSAARMGAGSSLLLVAGLVGCGSSSPPVNRDSGASDSGDGPSFDGSAIVAYDLRPPGDLRGLPTGCIPPEDGHWYEAIHVVIEVSWPSTMISAAGTGKVHFWNKVELTQLDALTGSAQPCGTVLPEVPLSGPAMIAAGGSRILVEVPDALWEAPGGPRFSVQAMRAGSVGGALEMQWNTQLGVMLADPKGPWPDSYQMLTPVDIDKDGNPGYTVRPLATGGYVLPPASLMVGTPPLADSLYLASRDVVAISGKRLNCYQEAGTADVSKLDGHIVGCHIKGGADCTPAQIDFLDQNRIKYQVKSATFEARLVTADATCVEIRDSMPVM